MSEFNVDFKLVSADNINSNFTLSSDKDELIADFLLDSSDNINGLFRIDTTDTIEASFIYGTCPNITAIFKIDYYPMKLSELENDADYVQDAEYVHTDNNFTDVLLNNLNNQSGTNTGDQDLSYLATKAELVTKVDEVEGKGLSTNDYTTAEKTKLAGIEEGAQVNPDLTPYATKAELPNKIYYGTTTGTTSVWTTEIEGVTGYYDNLMVVLKLGVGSTSNTTLNINNIGAKKIYYGNTSQSSYYTAGYTYFFVYDSTKDGGNGAFTATNSYYTDSNAYMIRLVQNIKATTAIVANNIIVGTRDGYTHLKDGNAFDITLPILWALSAINAGAVGTNNYLNYYAAIATTQSLTLTAYAPVYIKGTLSGKMFTPVSTTPLTQEEPTTEDGYNYLLLGYAYSSTSMYLIENHNIFSFQNGIFKIKETLQIQSDWNQDDDTKFDFIKNKPDLSGLLKLDQTTPQTTTGAFSFDTISVQNIIGKSGKVTSGTAYSSIQPGYMDFQDDLVPNTIPTASNGTFAVKFTSGALAGNTYTIIYASQGSWNSLDYFQFAEGIQPANGDAFDVYSIASLNLDCGGGSVKAASVTVRNLTANQLVMTDTYGNLTAYNYIFPNQNLSTGSQVNFGGLALSGTLNMGDAKNMSFGTTTGTKIGIAINQKIGFFGATPRVKPSTYSQSYTTTSRSITAYTANAQSTVYTGIDNTQVDTVYAKLSDLNNLRVAYENLRLRTENTTQVVNCIIDDFQSLGLLG